MAFRAWQHRLATLLSRLGNVRRQYVVVLWRLRRPSERGETVCSFTEPSPGIFLVVLTDNGKPEVRRLVHGIELLVDWSENVRARLRTAGWQEVDVPHGSHGRRWPVGRDHGETKPVTLVGRDPRRDYDQ